MNDECIWEDMKKAKTYHQCCLRYVDRKRKWARRAPYITIFIGIAGIVGEYFQDLFAGYALALLVIITILKLSIPYFRPQPDNELSELDNLAVYFGKTSQKLESLWRRKNDHNIILRDEYESIMKQFPQKEMLMNKLTYKVSDRENRKLEEIINQDLKKRYYE